MPTPEISRSILVGRFRYGLFHRAGIYGSCAWNLSAFGVRTGRRYVSGRFDGIVAVADGTEWTDPFMMTTYADWQNPTVTGIKVTDGTLTIGVRFKCNVKSWGTVDDVTLNRISD